MGPHSQVRQVLGERAQDRDSEREREHGTMEVNFSHFAIQKYHAAAKEKGHSVQKW